jgi:hypothetical protein
MRPRTVVTAAVIVLAAACGDDGDPQTDAEWCADHVPERNLLGEEWSEEEAVEDCVNTLTPADQGGTGWTRDEYLDFVEQTEDMG